MIRGKLEFVRAVKGEFDPVYRRYAGKFRVIDPDYRKDDAPMPDPGEPGPRDIFICHASPDKRLIVEPLVRAMDAEGISRWYDKPEIRWGESIVSKINTGLRDARFVLAVISPACLDRNWTQKEFHASLQLEVNSGRTRVLPLLCGSNQDIAVILDRLPLLADKKYLTWPGGPGPIVDELKTLLKPSGSS